MAEQVRAGINSLPKRGQKNTSGLALGTNPAPNLPRGHPAHGLPPDRAAPDLPEFLNIFKNSAVCSTIGLLELAAQGRRLVDYTAQPFESFIAVTVAYIAINVVVMALMKRLENKVRVPGYMGGK